MGPTPADGDVTLLSLTAFNAEPAGMLVLASMEWAGHLAAFLCSGDQWGHEFESSQVKSNSFFAF